MRLIKKKIQFDIAMLLLLLLLCSITPRQVLHDLFANHSHVVTKNTTEKKAQIATWSIHCSMDHFIAETPYTSINNDLVVSAFMFYASSVEAEQLSFSKSPLPQSSLRGPPAVI